MKMIDISDKDVTLREAVVEGVVVMSSDVVNKIKNKEIPKGDVLEAAKLAGIMAVKKTPDSIPLCHPIPIESVGIDFVLGEQEIVVRAEVKGRAKTGVEMEAFNAVSVACLTIYDMCKAFDRAAVISDLRLLRKTGGKTGDYDRDK